MITDSTGECTTTELAELVQRRRSIRHFSREAISTDLVLHLLEQAMWAPSPHNSQPWRFEVLHRGLLTRQLAEAMADRLARDLTADGVDRATIAKQTDRSRERIADAPVVLLCSLHREGLVVYPDQLRNDLEWQMAVQSVGAVLQSLFLLAWQAGIGTCWMAAPMYCADEVRAALGLDPDVEPQALVLMGTPDGPGRVRPRRPFDSVVTVR